MVPVLHFHFSSASSLMFRADFRALLWAAAWQGFFPCARFLFASSKMVERWSRMSPRRPTCWAKAVSSSAWCRMKQMGEGISGQPRLLICRTGRWILNCVFHPSEFRIGSLILETLENQRTRLDTFNSSCVSVTSRIAQNLHILIKKTANGNAST